MRAIVCLYILFIVGLVGAYNFNRNRTMVPSGWNLLNRAESNKIVHFRIALKQRNMESLERIVLERSNPSSPNFGKWLTMDQVLELVSPPSHHSFSILNWLRYNGIRDCDINGRDFIKCFSFVNVIEEVFDTQLYYFHHRKSGKVQISHFGGIKIPENFKDIISFISGISELWEPSIIRPKVNLFDEGKSNDDINEIAGGFIIPSVLRNLYGIPTEWKPVAHSSIAVIEFEDNGSFYKDDIKFWNTQARENISVDKIIGSFNPELPSSESVLDCEYAFSIAKGSSTWFWTVKDWIYEFLTDLASVRNTPKAISISWGWPENIPSDNSTNITDTRTFIERCNIEFLKLTATGITFFASSGDRGVSGPDNEECEDLPFENSYPASSPWVVSVGATAQNPSGKQENWNYTDIPVCSDYVCSNITEEIACSWPNSLITTGGGFSSYSTLPDWQKKHVQNYLKNNKFIAPPNYFNSTNRAYPDISASGHAYLIGMFSSMVMVDGTSCSTPVIAGIFSLINDYLLSYKNTTLGYLNPLLYNAPSNVWNDITSGSNNAGERCIAKYGFNADVGWDPVSGLGTPRFRELFNYIRSLYK